MCSRTKIEYSLFWICHRCGTSNPKEEHHDFQQRCLNEECSTIRMTTEIYKYSFDHNKSYKGWTCDFCTRNNFCNMKKCEECSNRYDNYVKLNEMENNMREVYWTCPNCKDLLNGAVYRCHQCKLWRTGNEHFLNEREAEEYVMAMTCHTGPSELEEDEKKVVWPVFSNETREPCREQMLGATAQSFQALAIDESRLWSASNQGLPAIVAKSTSAPSSPTGTDDTNPFLCNCPSDENLSSGSLKCKKCQLFKTFQRSLSKSGNERLKGRLASTVVQKLLEQEEKAAREMRQDIIANKKMGKHLPFDMFGVISRKSGSEMWRSLQTICLEDDDRVHYGNMNWELFRGNPEPNDVQQGDLKNCWFVSPLAVLADKNADMVKKIILNDEVCEYGVYHVRLCIDGMWETILLDSYFPCTQNGKLKYAKAKRKQLWVLLIEKAAARMFGDYRMIEKGNAVEAFSMLTGEPCECFLLKEEKDGQTVEVDADRIWEILKNADRKGFLISVSCGFGKNEHDMGLIAQHSYSLHKVKEFKGMKPCTTYRLIKLRNPWGDLSWKGDWRDNSPRWELVTEEDKKSVVLDGNNEGIFWMSLEDFMKYFQSIEICKVRPKWYESRIKGEFKPDAKGPWTLIDLHLRNDTEIDFGLFQKNMRGLRNDTNSEEPYVDLMIVVLEKVTSNDSNKLFGKVVAVSRRCTRSFVGTHVTLKNGSYIVACLAFKHWNYSTDVNRQQYAPYQMGSLPQAEYIPQSATNVHLPNVLNTAYVIAMHHSRQLVTTMVNTDLEAYIYALAEICITLATDGELSQAPEHYHNGDIILYQYEDNGSCISVVENTSHTKCIHVELDYSPTPYLVSARDLKTTDDIPPRHRQVVNVTWPNEPKMIYSIKKKKPIIIDQRAKGSHMEHNPPISPNMAGIYEPRPI